MLYIGTRPAQHLEFSKWSFTIKNVFHYRTMFLMGYLQLQFLQGLSVAFLTETQEC